MRILSAIVSLLILTNCSSPLNHNKSATSTALDYEEKELNNFADSIAQLNPEIWKKEVSFYSDSVYQSQQKLHVDLSIQDFELLKKDCAKNAMNTDLLQKLFPDEVIDSSYLDYEYPITVYNFGQTNFEYFAIEIYIDGWKSNVYFFDKNKIVARHHILHRYGLELNHFIDQDNKVVVYYKQNFASGTGIWWFNTNYFKYTDQSLIPVLNELNEANLQYPWGIRYYFLESSIEKTNPLTIKMLYNQEFLDETTRESITILKDSASIKYNWDENNKQFIADFSASKLNEYQILSYYLVDNELLFINTHYKLLQKMLSSNKPKTKQAALIYLKAVKDYHDKKEK
ncbi:MAG: hypothetical protein KA783_04240 [Chitinophagales bacterium]|jgi:hypothetical protein|nr:hypothetical protein [Chitinophagales bacterium]MBP7533632.1 hypothetical protein [Chitinophagales bacterium]